MIIQPYITPLGDHVAYYCKVDFENGQPPLDLQSPVELQDADWQAIAERMEAAEAATVQESLTVEPPNTPEESPVEKAFKQERDLLKVTAISYIQTHPDCTYEELLAQAPPNGMLRPEAMIQTYLDVCVAGGLIPSPDFEAFKQVICAMSADQLMRL